MIITIVVQKLSQNAYETNRMVQLSSKTFGVFLHECLTLSQPEPADGSVGEHDEIEPRFMWNWKKSIEGVVKWEHQLVKKIEQLKRVNAVMLLEHHSCLL